jgi:hypothetical protein
MIEWPSSRPGGKISSTQVSTEPVHCPLRRRGKSHPLEGSCQEAILLPHTTFDSFFPLRSDRHTPPPLGNLRRIRVFLTVASAPVRRTSHPSGSRRIDLSRPRQTSAPGTCVPQKTLGSLPCPIVYRVQISWLPRGSNFSRAHGRGVARLYPPVGGHLSRVETGTNQIGWMCTNFSPSLRPQPNFGRDLSQTRDSRQRARGLA